MKRFAIICILLVMAIFAWSENVVFNVNMNYQISEGNFDPAVDFVDVAGNFNDWGATPLNGEDPESDGIYTMNLGDLAVGFECEYKFRINGDWNNSEFPGGGANRTYTVISGTNLVDHWYNDEILPSIYVDVVFTLTDGTENYQDIKFKSNFDEWTLHQMADDGVAPDAVAGDHVWTVLVEDIPNGNHEWGAIEDDGSAYGIWLIEGDNLQYSIDEEGNVSGQTEYFVDPGSTQEVTVTFQVDVSLLTDVGEITITGDFNAWAVPGIVMTDPDMDNIYTVDVLMPIGSQINEEYKYLNDGEYEYIDNRSFMLDDSVTNQTLPLDYYNNMNPADYLEQTMILNIYVDMGETVFDSLAVCGNIEPLNWYFADHSTPLQLHTGTVWTTAVTFLEGSYRYLEFKFATDGQDLEAEYGSNHTCTLDESEMTQDVWCVYGEMGPVSDSDNNCISPTSTALVNYPNPFNPITTISYQIPSEQVGKLSIYNLRGQMINNWEGLSGSGDITWNGISKAGKPVASGLYFAVIKSGNYQATQKMMLLK